MMLLFEICPRCAQTWELDITRLIPMVLCGDDKEMQCDRCNNSFKLHQSEELLVLARQARDKKYE